MSDLEVKLGSIDYTFVRELLAMASVRELDTISTHVDLGKYTLYLTLEKDDQYE